jgi:hypothetical protein
VVDGQTKTVAHQPSQFIHELSQRYRSTLRHRDFSRRGTAMRDPASESVGGLHESERGVPVPTMALPAAAASAEPSGACLLG